MSQFISPGDKEIYQVESFTSSNTGNAQDSKEKRLQRWLEQAREKGFDLHSLVASFEGEQPSLVAVVKRKF